MAAKAKPTPKAKKPVYADMTGVSAGKSSLAPAIEKAMSEAVKKAAAEGVSDAGEIQKRMLAARQVVVDAAAKEAAAEAARQKALAEGK